MPLSQYLFSEVSPASAITAVSSQPVAGSTYSAPAGVACGGLDDYEALLVVAQLVGATGGTLDVYLQCSGDQGSTWVDCVHFAQLSAGHAAVSYTANISLFAQATAPVAVGTGTSPALAAATVVQGPWGDRLRLLMVGGTSTSAGAAVKVSVTGQRMRLREAGGAA